MLIVQKYGGSSVADAARIMRVARRITETYGQGNKVVVVLSAQGDTTDEMLAKANELNTGASKRELDMLLSTGEQQSVALMAIAIHKLGYPAISLNAGQVGINASSQYGNARIKSIETERVTAELERNNIVLVAGYQGVNRYGDITTLGRGASDTTAVALAAVLNADLCEIYTDVDGVYTADPRVVKNARKIDCISYDEMLELASLGAKVLHNRSVEMAKRYRIKLVVRSSITRAEGTLVNIDGILHKGETTAVEKTYVSGLAVDRDVARISVVGVMDRPGMAYQIFSLLAKEKVSVDIILQSIGRNNTKDISFTVTKGDLSASFKSWKKTAISSATI
jgi:aspartate kinase